MIKLQIYSVIFLLSATAPSAQGELLVNYEVPIQLAGELESFSNGWALVIIPPTGHATSLLETHNVLSSEKFPYHEYRRPGIQQNSYQVHSEWGDTESTVLDGNYFESKSRGAWSSILIIAESIYFKSQGSLFNLEHSSDLILPYSNIFKANLPHYAFRPQSTLSGGGAMIKSVGNTDNSVTIMALNVTVLEFQGLDSWCDNKLCARNTDTLEIPYYFETHSWRLNTQNGFLTLNASNTTFVQGGQGLSVSASGSIRLPSLQTSENLDQFGISVNGETLRGVGDITLSNVHTYPNNTGTAVISTNFQSASLDGVPVPISTTATASVASLTLIAILVWKGKALLSYIASQFTRLDMDAALEHPNRRAIYEYVDANPGPTFRELIRETNMAAGTARHHIAVLGRCDVLIERQYGQTMRYFHCDQEHLGDWDAVVVLRDPDVDRLYQWLLHHPDVIQRTVLDEAEGWGWSRSTAQHRLKKLVDNNLASVRDLGRVKTYKAIDRNVMRHT